MPRKITLRRSPRRHLLAADVDKIMAIVDDWPADERITWETLADKVADVFGHRWTRQALERSRGIKRAYTQCREASRKDGPKRPVEPAEVIAVRRLEALQDEVAKLKRTVAAYEERFVRYLYNAHARGITPGQLAAELPSIDRGQTDASKR